MTQTVKEAYIYEFSHENEAIVSIDPGDTIEVETIDCYSGALKTEEDLITNFPHLKANPATGPIYINNVNRGDVLEVVIKKIDLNAVGAMPTRPNRGLLGDYITEEQTRILSIENDMITLNETTQFPVRKMIGVIGVAPEGEAVPNTTPGDHGGNMDTTDITEGNILCLPVFHPGGLLALGDLHASMGDGELNGSGVEVGGKVTLQINKIENMKLNMPIVKTADEVLVIASAVEFKDAVRKAMLEAIRLMQDKNEMEFADAYRLLSAQGDLRVSQLVNPEVTVRIALPKAWVAV